MYFNKKKAYIVVGKNYGDEGKGQHVARIVNQELQNKRSCLVIKHNGGAQAGHTVVNNDNRIVFHQLGSGTPFGVPTFLCDTFMVDLVQLKQELEGYALTQQAALPDVFVSTECRITTILDVLVNSLAEASRGKDRHGSCGMGIYETQVRCEHEKYDLRLKDVLFLSSDALQDKLKMIRDEYVPIRVQELALTGIEVIDGKVVLKRSGCDKKSSCEKETDLTVKSNVDREKMDETDQACQKWIDLIYEDQLLENTANIMKETARYGVTPLTKMETLQFLQTFDSYVFESGQGLLLSEDNEEEYPHVSASMTGCKNAMDLIHTFLENTQPDLTTEICYVTRSYRTRHGAGRLQASCKREEINPLVQVDQTNQYNPWQETIRYGKHVSIEDFLKPVKKDLSYGKQAKVSLVITHLNETEGKMSFVEGDITISDFCAKREIKDIFSKVYLSYDEKIDVIASELL